MKGKFFKIALPLLFGGAILYWMYRDFDFRHVGDVMLLRDGLDVDAALAAFRHSGADVPRHPLWQTLEPLGEHSRTGQVA